MMLDEGIDVARENLLGGGNPILLGSIWDIHLAPIAACSKNVVDQAQIDKFSLLFAVTLGMVCRRAALQFALYMASWLF